MLDNLNILFLRMAEIYDYHEIPELPNVILSGIVNVSFTQYTNNSDSISVRG